MMIEFGMANPTINRKQANDNSSGSFHAGVHL